MKRCIMSLLVLFSTLIVAAPAQADSPSDRCAGLIDEELPDATVLSAHPDTTGKFTVPKNQGGFGEAQAGSVLDGLPDFCAVRILRTNPPAHDHIHIEVWLPLHAWNGRFQGVGGGGYVSGISFRAMAAALKSGSAVASTDTGHPAIQGIGDFVLGPSGRLKPQQIIDFGYLAVHQMTVTGKAVTRLFYRTPAEHAYFTGCSQGGRQALAEAEQYPADYDGILAGSTAVDFATMAPSQLWPRVVMQEAGDELPQCKVEAFHTAAVARCDRLDGVADGVVANAPACRIDARILVGTRTDCGTITATDAAVMNTIWKGPRTPDGRFLWYGLEPGADPWTLAGAPLFIADSWFRFWLARDPDFDVRTLTMATFSRMVQESTRDFPAVANDDSDLKGFARAGGKLLLWTGLSDPLIPPQGTIHYYQRVQRRMGPRTTDFSRLFVAPGAGHCGLTGNAGAVPTDPLSSLTAWVEHGTAPDSIAAAMTENGTVVRTRPVCAYPRVARYRGHGSTDDGANFFCARDFGHP